MDVQNGVCQSSWPFGFTHVLYTLLSQPHAFFMSNAKFVWEFNIVIYYTPSPISTLIYNIVYLHTNIRKQNQY